MTDETLHDLMLRVGLVRQRPSPYGAQRPTSLPRQPQQPYRSAFWDTPEMNQLQQLPSQALGNPRTLPMDPLPRMAQRQQQNDLAQFAMQREAGRNEVNTPPGTYFGQDTLEMTGLPSVARGIGHLRDGEPGQALPEVALGGLGVLGLVGGGGGARTAPPRIPRIPRTLPQIAEEARLPNAPPRLPGRATDGSVLPIRPPEPMRQSMVGGSDDLREAAAMRPQVRSGPDAGPSQSGRAPLEGEVLPPSGRSLRAVEPEARENFNNIREDMAEAARQTRGMIHIIDITLGERLATQAELGMMAPKTARYYLTQAAGDQVIAAAALRDSLAWRRSTLAELPEGAGRVKAMNEIGQHEAALRLLEGPTALPRTAPNGGPVQAGRDADDAASRFSYEGPNHNGARIYTVQVDNNHVARMEVHPDEIVQWSIRSVDGGTIGDLPVSQRSALALKALRGVQEALGSDARQFGVTAYTLYGDKAHSAAYRAMGNNAERYGFEMRETGPGAFELRQSPSRNAPNGGPVQAGRDPGTYRDLDLGDGNVVNFRAVESDPMHREIHWDISDVRGYGDDVEALAQQERDIRRRLDFTPGLRSTEEGQALQRQVSEIAARRREAQVSDGAGSKSYVHAFRAVERALNEELSANAGRGVTYEFYPDKAGLQPIYEAWARRFQHPDYRIEKAEVGYRLVPTNSSRAGPNAGPPRPPPRPIPPPRRTQ